MRYTKYLMVVFIGVLIFFVSALSAIYNEVKQQIIQDLNTRQMVHARQAARGIQDSMNNFISTLVIFAHLPEIIDMDDEGKRLLADYEEHHVDEIKGITRVDARGRIVYSVPYNAQAVGRDISSQEHIHEIMRTHETVISEIFTAVQGFRAIAIHVPVFRNRAYDGTIAFLISFDKIAQKHIENIHIGRSGYAWVISQKGFEISCPVPGHVGRSVFDTCRDFPDIIAMAKEMMKGREGITTYHFNRIRGNTADKVLKHAVYLPIPIGNTFWSVVVATPEEEVMASLTGFRLKLLMITLSLLFFCIVSTYLLVKSQVIIREQKKREEIVRALQESEESFRRLFDGSSDAILLLKEGHFVECNHAALTMLGNITRESLINSRPEDISPLYQPDGRLSAEAAKERIEAAYKEGHHRFEWVHLKADGTEFYTDVALTTIVIKGERMLHVTWRDITERKRADEEKERLQVRLLQAQKMESVGRLAGGVAHDFNNILQAILGYAEIALMKVDPKGPIYNNLQEIIKAGRRSADLTRQLLAFARKQVAIPKVLDLNNTVTGMLKMLQRLIGEDIDLAWIPGRDLWSVKMDPSQVDQIMANLVVNSRDAVAPGTGQVTIKTANTVLDKAFCSDHPECISGEYVMLSVSDNGCGMDQETLANIFEPFFTTKGVGEGTGLGLATVYGIVKQNEGLITIDSDPRKGATFTIYLPRFVSEPTQTKVERDEHTPRKGTETVLMVEDNDAVLDLGRIILEQLGYKVLIAHKPADAISIAEEYTGPIHLLITDVVMPEMNGRELAKRLVSMRQDMKCMYMSGYTADIIALHGVLNEGIYFIQKPFSINVLADKVRQVLET